jgi:hypothetical protein
MKYVKTSFNFWRQWQYEMKERGGGEQWLSKGTSAGNRSATQNAKRKPKARAKPKPKARAKPKVKAKPTVTAHVNNATNMRRSRDDSAVKPMHAARTVDRGAGSQAGAPTLPRPQNQPSSRHYSKTSSPHKRLLTTSSVAPIGKTNSNVVSYSHGWFTSENEYRLERLLHTRRITVVRNGRGFITQLFDEGKYATRLSEWGLTRDNMYGCLFDYLFSAGPGLQKAFEEEVAQLADPHVLKVLVQIRAGDKQIGGNAGTLSRHTQNLVSAFFSCASAVEAAALSRDREAGEKANFTKGAIWYLMTDSSTIKAYARERYGSKVLMHDSRIVNMLGNKDGYDMQAFSDVIGEQWCGSMCDYFITSSTSGLGLQAAFRSKHVHNRAFPIDTKLLSPDANVKVFSNASAFQQSNHAERPGQRPKKNGPPRPVLASDLCKAEGVAAFGARYSAI